MIYEILVEQDCTIDPRPSSKFISARASLSKASEIKLPTEEVAPSIWNKKASTERVVTVNKAAGPAVGIVTDRSVLPRLHSSSQGLKEDHEALEFLSFYTPSCYHSS